jgi:hypothetical protein
MSEAPGKDDPGDADELYRRASAQEDSRPSERVRRRVLDHAAQLAAQRAALRVAHRTWRRPAIFGTLAAAAVACLLITPRFLTPPVPPTAALPAAALPPKVALPPATTDLRTSEARAPAGAAPMPNRMAETAAATAGKSSPPLQNMASARSRAGAELRRAAAAGDLAQLQTQLDRPSAIDARDESGRTALMLAVLRAQSQVVDVLLASGADPNAADDRGTTPLQAAVAANEPAIAAALRRAGAR